MRKAPKLTSAERSEIEILHTKGYSARAIAKVLGRSPNTIASELKRNSCGDDRRTNTASRGSYKASRAKQKAYVRRKYATYQGKKIQENNKLRLFIIARLKDHWNPDEIAGYLRNNPALGIYVSKTAIYEWLRSSWGQQYCRYLYSKRYRQKPRKKTMAHKVISARVSIANRPKGAANRSRYGHWEQDAVVSSKRSGSTASLSVLQERKSRYVYALLRPNMKPHEHTAAAIQLTAKAKIVSITYDNGIENRSHQTLHEYGVATFFTDPYSSWQKGGVENANKMLRRYFPKGTDFATISQTDVVDALWRINNKPRKILGYKSSLQVAKEKGLLKDEVS